MTRIVSTDEMTKLTKGMPRGLARMLQTGRTRFRHGGHVYQCAPTSSPDDSFLRQSSDLEHVKQVAAEPKSPAAARDVNPLREAHNEPSPAAEAVRSTTPSEPNPNPLLAAEARLKGHQ
jgi:hypothetical protein